MRDSQRNNSSEEETNASGTAVPLPLTPIASDVATRESIRAKPMIH